MEKASSQFTVVEWWIIVEVYAKEGIEQEEVASFLVKDYGCCILRVLASLSQLVEKNCLIVEAEKVAGKSRRHYHLTPPVAQIFRDQNLYF